MIITPVKHGLEDLIGVSGPRTPGLHMSTIYGDLYSDLEPKRYSRDTPLDPNRLEAGLAFESFLEEALKARLGRGGGRPDEMEHTEPGIATPILFNPDLIIFNGTHRVGEIKLTWLSCSEMPTERANCFPPKFDKYQTQMMAYCHCLDTAYSRLIGFFVNGGYEFLKKQPPGAERKPPTPQLLAWDIEYTPRELRENWQMLINHARSKKML